MAPYMAKLGVRKWDCSKPRSKGFAFVEMSSDAEAKAAIDGLNGKELQGRAMTVNEARPKEDSGGRSNFGGGGGGGGRRGGNDRGGDRGGDRRRF